MKAIKVSLCPETGIPLVPEEIKERVRNGEEISIELMSGTTGYVKNAMRWNVAGLWIDGARIETTEKVQKGAGADISGIFKFPQDGAYKKGTGRLYHEGGRYPKNIIHDNSEEVLAEFAKAGVRKSGGAAGKRAHKKSTCYGKYNAMDHPKETSRGPDIGSAARYYQSCPQDNHCPTCNNMDVLPLDTSFEEWVKDTNGTREEYERLLKSGICDDCHKLPGRYPKNILIDGSEEVKAEFDKAGVRKSGGKPGVSYNTGYQGTGNIYGDTIGKGGSGRCISDTGSAERFYQTCPPDPCPTCNGTKLCEVELSFDDFMNNPYEPPPEYEACPDCVICPHCFDTGVELPDGDIDDWGAYAKEHPCPECRMEEPVRFKYVSKSSKRERNRGLDGMEPRQNVEHRFGRYRCKKCTRLKLAIEPCTCDDPDFERTDTNTGNSHPAVKPLSLIRYLCKISRTPTGGIVLDPFLGSGTTSLAAFLEGRASIGIEQSAEYCEIAANRLAYEQSLDPDERVK